MLHILWVILKIIGIILASLLGIILLLLLLILFVPVRYRIKGTKREVQTEGDMGITGNVRVSWLFGLAAFCGNLKEKEFLYDIRIFGISLNWLKKTFSRPSENLSENFCEEVPENLPEKVPEKVPEETKDRKKDDEAVCETAKETDTSESSKPGISVFERVKGLFDKIKNTGKKVGRKIWQLPANMLRRIKKIRLTILSLCDTINYWKEFLQKDSTKQAIGLLKEEIFKLLKHILPKKIKGNVTYGFEDPCQTGQSLAVISVFYPLYYKQVNICPDFTQNILIGDVDLKGRIYVCFLVKTAIKVYFDKNVQSLIKKFEKK